MRLGVAFLMAAVAAMPAAPVKSALDKATLEAYVRHLFVWGPQIKLVIDDPKPSANLPGFFEVGIHGSQGPARQDETLLISKDGQKILRATVYDVTQNPFKAELQKLKTEFQPSLGAPGASVVIVLFTDFQCPYCKLEAKMLRDNLLAAFPRQVRLYFKDYPLESIHPWAKSAAIAGRCVFRQNPSAFWLYHDWVYERQQEITPANFDAKIAEFAKANEKQIDATQLAECVKTKATEPEVDRSMAEARDLGVFSTPTMFVNGRRLSGQVDWSNLRTIIETEIEYQKTAQNAGENCCSITLSSPLNN